MRNAEKWGDPDLGYRKREGYIAGVRAFFERPNLKNWTTFEHQDLVERNQLALTFNTRHLHLSDGKNHKEFGKLFKDAKEWGKTASPVKKKKRKSAPKVAKPKAKKSKVKADEDEDDIMMYVCPKTGNVVPMIDLVS